MLNPLKILNLPVVMVMGFGLWRATIVARTDRNRSARMLLNIARLVKRTLPRDKRKEDKFVAMLTSMALLQQGAPWEKVCPWFEQSGWGTAFGMAFSSYFADENYEQAHEVALEWRRHATGQVATRVSEMKFFFSRYGETLTTGDVGQIQLARRQERLDDWNANQQRGPRPDSMKEGTRDYELILPFLLHYRAQWAWEIVRWIQSQTSPIPFHKARAYMAQQPSYLGQVQIYASEKMARALGMSGDEIKAAHYRALGEQ